MTADNARDDLWLVLCEDVQMGTFADQEDAEDMASSWNSAYPPSKGYPEFVVKAVPRG